MSDQNGILSGLNPQQEEAVKHHGSPLLIIAGAGSGKTTVLTRRIAYLLDQRQVYPHEILAITFTNKAANEMRERIMDRVGPGAKNMWIMTFHSACVRILREHAEAIRGLKKNFTIYDTDDSVRLIGMIMKDMGIDNKRISPRAILSVISNYKNELADAAHAGTQAYDPDSKLIAEVYAQYQQRLLSANAMDFDDLIANVVYIFRTKPAILETYQRRFKHVLIDEYQDTNHAQYELVHLLVGDGKNIELCVVGDADQSIYAFRGATIRNIEEFEKDYPAARTIVLEQNYRSTQNILDAANAVISHNPRIQDKKLWSDRGQGSVISGYAALNEHDEAHYVAYAIEDLIDSGYSYSDIAVMYRTNTASRSLEEAFMRAGTPYIVIGGTRFYERAEVRDMLAYLRVIDNSEDEVSLRRIVNMPRRGIGDSSLAQISVYARSAGISLWQALVDTAEDKVAGIGPRARKSCAAFISLMESLKAGEDTVDERLQRVVDETGYGSLLQDSKDPQDQVRLDNIHEFIAVARESQQVSLADFLEHISLIADSDQLSDSNDVVTLMTLHTAKGLEFPVVFLVGWEDGQFPHSRSFNEIKGIEEERRLAYVGITRAREKLYISHAEQRAVWNQYQTNPPSRFLDDIPANLIEWSGKERMNNTSSYASSRSVNTRSIPQASSGARAKSLDLRPGDKVNHDKYGLGTVMEVTNSQPAPTVMINFGSHGTVRIMLLGTVPMEKL